MSVVAPTAVDDRRAGLGEVWVAVRSRLGLVALLLALAGLAWWSTADRMAGMDGGPGTDLGALGWFLGVWVVMMAAMMLPSMAPTAALYARMTRRRGLDQPLLFTAAYLVVWGAVGLLAYGVFELGRSLFGGALAWHAGGRWVAGGVLALTAVSRASVWPIAGARWDSCSDIGATAGAARSRWARGTPSGAWGVAQG
jgi:hypothetical protein